MSENSIENNFNSSNYSLFKRRKKLIIAASIFFLFLTFVFGYIYIQTKKISDTARLTTNTTSRATTSNISPESQIPTDSYSRTGESGMIPQADSEQVIQNLISYDEKYKDYYTATDSAVLPSDVPIPTDVIKAGDITLFMKNLGSAAPDQKFLLDDNRIMTKAQILENWNKSLDMVPTNPTSVEVICVSTGKKIISGQPTSCKDPKFTWSGAKAREPGAKILGYYIYLGEKNNTAPFGEDGFKNAIDPKGAAYVAENSVGPSSLEYLQSGRLYYLMVRTATDSTNKFWSTGLTILDKNQYKVKLADVLFEYQYEK